MGDFNFPPSAAFDSRHNLCLGTTVRRGAPGRGCLWALARRRGGCAFCPKRKIAPYDLERGVTTFRPLLLPTPGTTYALAQFLAAERRGGGASGRLAAAGAIVKNGADLLVSGVFASLDRQGDLGERTAAFRVLSNHRSRSGPDRREW